MNVSLEWLLIFLTVPISLLLVAFFWPECGILARLKRWIAALQRRHEEDALKSLFNLQKEGHPVSIGELNGSLNRRKSFVIKLVGRMKQQGLIEQLETGLKLTASGKRLALQIVRAHRLWERYLADEARMPLEQIHGVAHHREHGMTLDQVDELDAALGYPSSDPHGDPIPNPSGEMRRLPGDAVSLTVWVPGEWGRIAHLEDEPPPVFARLLDSGLQVGKVVTLLEETPTGFVLTDGENELVVDPSIAGNVYLQLFEKEQVRKVDGISLAELPNHAAAEILELDESCQGFTRRRFLDLGLTPGTEIYPELQNFFGEPRAYRVRGTLIALRNAQAAKIWVRPLDRFYNAGSQVDSEE